MITGDHAVIRSADPDDAVQLQRLYDSEPVRASLLDRKRELTIPTADELRELLGRKENAGGMLLTVEDKTGVIRGFCGLRPAGLDLAYGEIVLLLFDDGDYAVPLASETYEYLRTSAFVEKRFNKVVAHCLVRPRTTEGVRGIPLTEELDGETAWRVFLLNQGFGCDGRQRDIMYAGGRWHSLESFSLFNGAAISGKGPPASLPTVQPGV